MLGEADSESPCETEAGGCSMSYTKDFMIWLHNRGIDDERYTNMHEDMRMDLAKEYKESKEPERRNCRKCPTIVEAHRIGITTTWWVKVTGKRYQAGEHIPTDQLPGDDGKTFDCGCEDG